MAELEIHHEEHISDPVGQRVGVLAAALAVALAVVTIASHRTHTAAIIHKSNANDEWSHYQSTRIKYHNLELGQSLARIMGENSAAAVAAGADFATQLKEYEKRSKDIQAAAQKAEELSEADENRALRYDLGEGLLEIALVLSSLYFISKKMMFPALGIIAGAVGALIAATGLAM